jgi:hypothetical protein
MNQVMRPYKEMTIEELRDLVAKAPKTPQERYDRAIEALHSADSPYARWCALGAAAKTSVEIGSDEEATGYAHELRQLAPTYADDWNYGNAIQDFSVVFGLLSLRGGDAEAARDHLLAAGRSPGSPQMVSFGPNMSLAKALLEAGHHDAVLQYFDLCRSFWEMDRGQLDKWTDEVGRGLSPNFGANLIY